MMTPFKFRFTILALSIALLTQQNAFAEEVAISSPEFEIVSYQVQGNTLLKADEVSQVVRPFTGVKRNFGDVQQALEALQDAYQKRGFGSVQVVLPEQELNKGVVLFKILEQKIGIIKVEGNQYHDEANILNSVPSLKQNQIPSTTEIAEDLRLANENPSKQTAVLFKSSETDDSTVDATLKVVDEKPSKVFLTLDNTGNQQTGNARIGVGYQHYNVLNHDDRFTAQVVTSPESFMEDVKIFGLGYSRPLYDWGDSIDLTAGYSDVDAGSILSGALNIASKGLVLGAKYNWNLRKIGTYEHKVVLGLDYKSFRPSINTQDGTNQTPHASTTPLSVTYLAEWRKQDWQLAYNIGLAHNLAIGKRGGQNSLGENEDVAFPWLSDVHFTKLMFGADASHSVFKNWVAHAGFEVQLTDSHLHPGEQFGIGGMDSVRGWNERSFSADEGYRATIDITSPDIGHHFSNQLGMRGIFFLDKGFVSNNENILHAPAAADIDIASIGAGLRVNFAKKLLGRLDYAYVIDGDRTNDPDAVHAQRHSAGDMFGHFSIVWVW